MKSNRTFLSCLLTLMLALAGPASLVASAQGAGEVKPAAAKADPVEQVVVDEAGTYIIYRAADGSTACREATPAEARQLRERAPGLELRQINHLQRVGPKGGGTMDRVESGAAEEAVTGLTIVLRGTAQLDANPEAKAAFTRAAAAWEAIITTPITVVIDVDYG
ncbi:MAG TPA: hypothetical protein VD968_06055, partial [Pyrinomonadaceae bacterium]|nr:hypothetical protein [Pyrinomonadaceae bacterium]